MPIAAQPQPIPGSKQEGNATCLERERHSR
jgi:hypothetical protein